MQCPQCNSLIEEGTTFCGNCGTQLVPLQAQGATIVASAEEQQLANNSSIPMSRYGQPFSAPQASPAPQVQPYVPATDTPGPSNPPQSPSRPRRTNVGRIALIAIVILLLVAGGTIGITTLLLKNNNAGSVIVPPGATGLVSFLDSQNGQGRTDALRIKITGLSTPPAGFQYEAWLVNDQNEQTIALGTLVASGQTFSLNYAGDGSRRQQGTNLLGAGNKLKITLEQGQVNLPTGKVVLSGTFPPKAFVHIRHLLFSFPTTPGKVGLLVGLRDQTQHLDAQALILQNAVSAQNSQAITCAAQNIIDIIEGTNGSNYQPLSDQCASQNITAAYDGFGLLGSASDSQGGYIATAAAHASLAATQPDATDNIRIHAQHIEIAMTNIKGWVTTVDADAVALLSNPSNTAKVSEIVTLSDHAYHGVDINGDEQIDPVPGEAGAITAYIHGQLMAALPLVLSS